jgi:hypothetical protein
MAALTTFYETKFGTTWEAKSQQTDSRLASAVLSDSFEGKRKWYNKIDTGVMTEVTTRKGTTPDGDSTGDKYWIYRRKFEFVKTWDEDDEMQLGQIALPDSAEMQNAVYAENRTKDDVIISSFDATRYIGENGTTTDAFDTAFDVAVNYGGSNVGITVAKVLRAKKLLDEQEVPDDERYFACSAQQIQDMLLLTQVTSADYASVKALEQGTVNKFCGFTFIRTERLTRNTGTDVRTCFAWHKSGVKFAHMGRSVHMDMLPSQRHAKQLRCVARMGAVRTENTRVVRIYADESP